MKEPIRKVGGLSPLGTSRQAGSSLRRCSVASLGSHCGSFNCILPVEHGRCHSPVSDIPSDGFIFQLPSGLGSGLRGAGFSADRFGQAGNIIRSTRKLRQISILRQNMCARRAHVLAAAEGRLGRLGFSVRRDVEGHDDRRGAGAAENIEGSGDGERPRPGS